MPPAGYPAFLQYLQSGRVSNATSARAVAPAVVLTEMGRQPWVPRRRESR